METSKLFFCHECQKEFNPPSSSPLIECVSCKSSLCEEIERRNSSNSHIIFAEQNSQGNLVPILNPTSIRRKIDSNGRIHFSIRNITTSAEPQNNITNEAIRNNINISNIVIDQNIRSLIQAHLLSELNNVGVPPASKESIESLKSISHDDKSEKDCSICKENFKIDDDLKIMPCNHSFHSNCLIKWLELRNSCPICRFQLKKN